MDLTSQAYQRLRHLIASGGIPAGSPIGESDVAARLRISRTPVRGALHRLWQEGWITSSGTEKRVRLVVSPLTRGDARELFELLGALDGMAARLAAGLPPPARRALAAELRALNGELRREALSPRPDPRVVLDRDSALHTGLVEAVRAPRLRSLYHVLTPQADRYFRSYGAALAPAAPDAASEHDGILAAIEAGDAAAAEAAVHAHWAGAAGRIVRIIESEGEKGSW